MIEMMIAKGIIRTGLMCWFLCAQNCVGWSTLTPTQKNFSAKIFKNQHFEGDDLPIPVAKDIIRTGLISWFLCTQNCVGWSMLTPTQKNFRKKLSKINIWGVKFIHRLNMLYIIRTSLCYIHAGNKNSYHKQNINYRLIGKNIRK